MSKIHIEILAWRAHMKQERIEDEQQDEKYD